MEQAANILVIIVSSVLALFLAAGIVLLIVAIRLVSQAKRVVAKAEKLANEATHFGDILTNMTGPLGLAKTITKIVKVIRNR